MNKVDISNLRFYAEMAREFKWATDVIHSTVIEATLNEIADRFEAENQRLKAEVGATQKRHDIASENAAMLGADNSQLREELQAANLAHEQYREWAAGQIEQMRLALQIAQDQLRAYTG